MQPLTILGAVPRRPRSLRVAFSCPFYDHGHGSPICKRLQFDHQSLPVPLSQLNQTATISFTRSSILVLCRAPLMEKARKLAEAEGVALNQLINVAEKLSALRTVDYFTARAARADIPKALKVLKRASVGKPPIKGDELPPRKRRA